MNVQWAPPWLQKIMADKKFPIFAGIGGAVVLILFLGVMWMFSKARKKKKKAAAVEMDAQLPAGAGAKAIGPADVEKQLEDNIAEQAVIKEKQAQDIMNSLKLPAVKTKKTEVLVKHISTEAKKDPEAMALVIRSWLHASDR